MPTTTKPMTPESRAKEVVDKIWGAGAAAVDPAWREYEALIASAIRSAENDKLEEAALWFEEQAKIVKSRPHLKEFPASLSEPICEILDGIPADIRDLKSKDTP